MEVHNGALNKSVLDRFMALDITSTGKVVNVYTYLQFMHKIDETKICKKILTSKFYFQENKINVPPSKINFFLGTLYILPQVKWYR